MLWLFCGLVLTVLIVAPSGEAKLDFLWEHIFPGIIGAIVALIVAAAMYWPLKRLFEGRGDSSRTVTLILVIAIVACLQFVKEMEYYRQVRGYFQPTYQIGQDLDKRVRVMLENFPEVRKKFLKMNGTSKKAYIRDQVSQGMVLMPYKDLMIQNRILLKMYSHSGPLCVAAWKGATPEAGALTALAVLDQADRDIFYELAVGALRAKLENKEKKILPEDAMSKGVTAIGRLLPAEEAERYKSILAKGVEVSDEDACWAVIKIREKLEKIDHIQAVAVSRAFLGDH